MPLIRLIVLALISLAAALPLRAATLEELVAALPAGGYDERAEVTNAIAANGDPRAAAVLSALSEGELQALKADGAVVRVARKVGADVAFDPLTGAEIGPIGRRDGKKIKVNNKLRRVIAAAIGTLTLRSPDRAKRLEAAASILKTGDAVQICALDAAIEAEEDADVREAFRDARASAVMNADVTTADKVAALERLHTRVGLGEGPSGEPGRGDPTTVLRAAPQVQELCRVQCVAT